MHNVVDLTNESALLAEDRAASDPEGVRALLWALNLQPSSASVRREADVFDLAVFRATGDRHLAGIFGAAA